MSPTCSEPLHRVAGCKHSLMLSVLMGTWSAQVEDWETGQPVVIKLDPLKAPADTAEDLYKVARKQDRTGGAIMPIIQARMLLSSQITCLLHEHLRTPGSISFSPRYMCPLHAALCKSMHSQAALLGLTLLNLRLLCSPGNEA